MSMYHMQELEDKDMEIENLKAMVNELKAVRKDLIATIVAFQKRIREQSVSNDALRTQLQQLRHELKLRDRSTTEEIRAVALVNAIREALAP